MGRIRRCSMKRPPIKLETMFIVLIVYIPFCALLAYLHWSFYDDYARNDNYTHNVVYMRLLLGLLVLVVCLRDWLAWCAAYKSMYLLWIHRKTHKVDGATFNLILWVLWTSLLLGLLRILPSLWGTRVYGDYPEAFFTGLSGMILTDFFRLATLVSKANPSPLQRPPDPTTPHLPIVNSMGVPRFKEPELPRIQPGETGILHHTGWRLIPYFLTICIALEVSLIVLERAPAIGRNPMVKHGLVLAVGGCLFILFGWASVILVCLPENPNKYLTRAACLFAIVAEVSLLTTLVHGLLPYLTQQTVPAIMPESEAASALLQHILVPISLALSIIWNWIARRKWRFHEVDTLSYRNETVPQVDGSIDSLKTPEKASRLPFLAKLRHTSGEMKKIRRPEAHDIVMPCFGLSILGVALFLLLRELVSGEHRGAEAGLIAAICLVAILITVLLALLLIKGRGELHPVSEPPQLDLRPAANSAGSRKASVAASDMFTFERRDFAFSPPGSHFTSPNASGRSSPTKVKTEHNKRAARRSASPEADRTIQRDFGYLAALVSQESEPQPVKRKPTVHFALDGENFVRPGDTESEWETTEDGSVYENAHQSRRSLILDGSDDAESLDLEMGLPPRAVIRSGTQRIRRQWPPRRGLLAVIDENGSIQGRIGADEEFEMQKMHSIGAAF